MGKSVEEEYEEYLKGQSIEQEYEEYKQMTKADPILGAEEAMQTRGDFDPDTLSDVAVSIPQGITTFADEIEARYKAGGDEQAYETNVKGIRDRLALARDRSPIAAPLTELATGVGTSLVPGIGAGKLTSVGAQVIRGGVEGLGTAEDKFSEEGAINAGLGMGTSALGSLVSGAFKKLTTANPNKIRANVLGANSSQFKEIGIKEREQIAKELNKMGLFGKTKMLFDPVKGKFVSVGKTLDNLEKPARDTILSRLDDAGNQIQKEKMRILGKYAQQPIDIEDIRAGLDDVVQIYSKKGTDMSGRAAQATKIRDAIIEDITEDSRLDDGFEVTVETIERAKQRLSNDVGNYGKNPLLQKTPDEAQIYQNMYASINKKLRAALNNTKYADFNDMQHKMLTAKADVIGAIAAEDGMKAQAGWGGWFNKIANETLGSPEAGLGMARASEILQKPGIKQGMKYLARPAVNEAPFSTIRYFDTSIPNNVEVPFAPEEQMEETEAAPLSGYGQPNGIKPAFGKGQYNPISRKYNSLGSDEMAPMQIAKTRLPRTTEGLLQNKDLVIQKMILSGADDEMIDTMTQALNEDPESLDAIAPLMTMQFPTAFEKSKYNMFNGKILDPNERAKAADETSKREDIGSIQKAKIISELNKTGKYLGE